MLNLPGNDVVTCDDMTVAPELQPLFDYLARRGSFVHLDCYRPDYLPILSRDVLRRIAAGDDEWQAMVPPAVAELIMKRSFFGHSKELNPT
jgi:hypothetical protein